MLGHPMMMVSVVVLLSLLAGFPHGVIADIPSISKRTTTTTAALAPPPPRKAVLLHKHQRSVVTILPGDRQSQDASAITNTPTELSKKNSLSSSVVLQSIPRGGGAVAAMTTDAVSQLGSFLNGGKTDALVLLAVTALNTPISERLLKISPILGLLLCGFVLGPNGCSVLQDIHGIEHIADYGIVLFLFEMGLHVDRKTLWKIRKDVFGIGGLQFTSTAIVMGGLVCRGLLGLPTASSILIGWSLALSSSAFVLQLLQDKQQMGTPYGRAAFGTLLWQDLMVVPLLVLTPILAGGEGTSASTAVVKALVAIAIALVALVGVFGQFALHPMIDAAVGSGSKEAVMGCILMSVFGGSFLTEGLGLSNTLGAFLIGMLTAESKHKHQIEQDMSVVRGILVGLFFCTVGFEIDANLIWSQPMLIASIVVGILLLKTMLATGAAMQFGVPFPTAQRIGLVLSQGGEFAFVAFRTARAAGILTADQTRLLLTVVSLTMACTPVLEGLGAQWMEQLEANGGGVRSVAQRKPKRKFA